MSSPPCEGPGAAPPGCEAADTWRMPPRALAAAHAHRDAIEGHTS